MSGAAASRGAEPLFAFSVQSGEMAVREALRGVIDGLGPLNLDMEEAGTVELVLAEALNNIVEHAYGPGAVEMPIRIEGRIKSDGLHFSIVDHGRALPDDRPPLGQLQDLDVPMDDLPEGGFGWFMIQNLAKDVVYQRIDRCNQLKLRVAVGLSGRA